MTTEENKTHIAKTGCELGRSYGESNSAIATKKVNESLYIQAKKFISENKKDIDVLLVCAMTINDNTTIDKSVEKYLSAKGTLKQSDISNEILTALCCYIEPKFIIGYGTGENYPKRLDKIKIPIIITDEIGKESIEESDKSFVDWEKRNSWGWQDVVEPICINMSGKNPPTNFPDSLEKFCNLVYLYYEMSKNYSTSSLDNVSAGFSFPFIEDELDKIYLTSEFGPRSAPTEGASSYHRGWDLAPDNGEALEIHSIANGKVVDADFEDGGAGNYVAIAHDNDYYSVYMHMKNLEKKIGDTVTKGQVIGHVGNTGIGTGAHLHFQVEKGERTGSNAINPGTLFPQVLSMNMDDSIGDQLKK